MPWAEIQEFYVENRIQYLIKIKRTDEGNPMGHPAHASH
jgi:hypothetical protein